MPGNDDPAGTAGSDRNTPRDAAQSFRAGCNRNGRAGDGWEHGSEHSSCFPPLLKPVCCEKATRVGTRLPANFAPDVAHKVPLLHSVLHCNDCASEFLRPAKTMPDATITDTSATRIGILSPGEMGAALGMLLTARGHFVCSTADGRSARTVELGRSAQLELLPTAADVVRESEIIISTVTPASAVEVAGQVAAELSLLRSNTPSRTVTYVDANSVAPHTAIAIDHMIRQAGAEFVDATIHGLASRLETQGTLFVSGGHSDAIAGLFGDALRVRNLGSEPGCASLMKMMLGGMSKGIVGLFLQSALLAESFDMTDSFCAELDNYFPDVLSFVRRSLPTCPIHAPRRAAEMLELQDTLDRAGVRSDMAAAAVRVFDTFSSSLPAAVAREPRCTDLNELIKMISETQRDSRPQGRVETVC